MKEDAPTLTSFAGRNAYRSLQIVSSIAPGENGRVATNARRSLVPAGHLLAVQRALDTNGSAVKSASAWIHSANRGEEHAMLPERNVGTGAFQLLTGAYSDAQEAKGNAAMNAKVQLWHARNRGTTSASTQGGGAETSAYCPTSHAA